jgi:3-methyladenine DNA glycosylase AlkD
MKYKNRSVASKKESEIKKLTRNQKLTLIASNDSNDMEYVEFQKKLRLLNNSKKAKILAGFFKTGKGQYGEGDVFLGVTVPEIRKLVASYIDMPLEQTLKLLASKFHEERLSALLIMVTQYKRGKNETKKKIFEAYLKNTKFINSWDLVDSSAHYIVGAYLSDKSKEIIYKLAKSKSLWERRIAMISTFYQIKMGDGNLTMDLAEKLLNDKEDLMHKAVGWMLREAGKHCSQEQEEAFLEKNWHLMARTTLRYAIERFEEKKRQKYLKRKL